MDGNGLPDNDAEILIAFIHPINPYNVKNMGNSSLHISDIELQGEYFADTTRLSFFSKGERFCLVYGENGSGKTTISKGIYEYANDEIEKNQNFSVFNLIADDKKTYSSFPRENIFSFNDIFTLENVKFDKGSLRGVVIFGEQNELSEKIEKANQDLNILKEKIAKTGTTDTFEHDGGFKRSKEYLKKTNLLKEIISKFWTGKHNEILGSQGRKRMMPNDLTRILEMRVPAGAEELESRILKLSQVYKAVSSTSSGEFFGKAPLWDAEIAFKLFGLLEKEINKPIGGQLVQRIGLLLEDGKFNREKTEEMVKSHDHFCPTCLQPLDAGYLEKIKDAINDAFRGEATNLSNEIGALILRLEEPPAIAKDQMIKMGLNDEAIHSYENLLRGLQKSVLILKQLSKDKINDPYSHVSFDKNAIESSISEYNDFISDFNKRVEEVNKAAEKKGALKKNIENVIDEFTVVSCEKAIEQMRTIEAGFAKSQEAYDSLKKQISEKAEEIGRLEAKFGNISISMDEMNHDLASIFGDKTRLQLNVHLDENKNVIGYDVLSRGKPVKLADLSSGEQNIISLVYFFSTIKSGKFENKYYKDPLFVVIDDPISSFDAANKIGIASYVQRMIKRILNGCKDSQCILLTHDFTTFNLMDKFLPNEKMARKRLGCKTLSGFDSGGFNQYTSLFKGVISSLIDKSKELPSGILNDTRRFIEWFCTFEFASGSGKVINNDTIINSVEPKFSLKNCYDDDCVKFREQLFSMPSKTFLDIGSHSEKNAKQEELDSFFFAYDDSQKRKVIWSLVLMVFYLNPTHVRESLRGKENLYQPVEDVAKQFEQGLL